MFSTLIRCLQNVVITLFVSFVFLCFFEGASSWTLVVRNWIATKSVSERAHTQYDPLLGWKNIPQLSLRDFYGPGRTLTINSQGFRNHNDFLPALTLGKKRLICSGDSFTLGWGVGDNQTWCHVLSESTEFSETVNMGQGGYGIDQAYLWYMRDGALLQHQLQLFAFIEEDVIRMAYDHFAGYPKPLVRATADGVVPTNIPLPERAFYMPWLTENIASLRQTSLVRLFNLMVPAQARWTFAKPTLNPEQAMHLAFLIFEKLKKINLAKGSKLYLIHLPTQGDYRSEIGRSFLKAFHDQMAQHRGLKFVSLLDEFDRLSNAEMESLFTKEKEERFLAGARHYNEKGHNWVARLLIKKIPELRRNPK